MNEEFVWNLAGRTSGHLGPAKPPNAGAFFDTGEVNPFLAREHAKGNKKEEREGDRLLCTKLFCAYALHAWFSVRFYRKLNLSLVKERSFRSTKLTPPSKLDV
jgi:hypothetical protein